MKTLLLLSFFGGVILAQNTPPPLMLTNLPANVSENLVIAGTAPCGLVSYTLGWCSQLSGANWFLVTQGGTGGIRYDSAGNLLIGVSISPLSGLISAIAKMSPNGTPSSFINFPQTGTGCRVTSSSTLLGSGTQSLQAPFSFNPALTALNVVTSNEVFVYTWDPTTSSGVCL